MFKRFSQRSVASITALVVFTATINCYCGIIHPIHQNDAARSPCCDQDDDCCRDKGPCSHSVPAPNVPNDENHQCPHCLGLLTIEKTHIQADQFRPQLLPMQPLAIEMGNFRLFDSNVVCSIDYVTGISSETTSPTLLRLHCAHTI
jgi:hypothetical protein